MSGKLTTNQIELRAKDFSEIWKDATYEKGEAQTFYNDFFDIFNVKRRNVARYEEHVRKLNNTSGFIDLFWPSVLIAEHKSLGSDLVKATEQLNDYFDALPTDQRPRFRLVCDFQTFQLTDLDDKLYVTFKLNELYKNIHHFNFILGRERPKHDYSDPLNDKAAFLVASLHSNLLDTHYDKTCTDKFLIRLIFCMFADVSGIFEPRGAFLDLLEAKTKVDGLDLGQCLAFLFQTLNTPESNRQSSLDPDYKEFPYINGDLFEDNIPIVSSNKAFRDTLIKAAQFNWKTISPAIFGALFQKILTKEATGGHATSEKNILKVLYELVLKDLIFELNECKTGANKVSKLLHFKKKLASLKFLDPCCGCGNFLAIAYREIRRIEIQVNQALLALNNFDPQCDSISDVDVDQFFGIEILEAPAKIAEISLWLTDHQMNMESTDVFNKVFTRIPLKRSPKIFVRDALEVTFDWNTVLVADECSYVVGNPPFAGSKKKLTPEVRQQLCFLAKLPSNSGTLDFASGWLLKTAEYIDKKTKAAFVLTNSLIQGEQVGQLFPAFFKHNVEIEFAHQTSNWDPIGPNGAQVDVIIIGFSKHAKKIKVLYEYDNKGKFVKKVECNCISPYLRNGDGLIDPNLVVSETSKPINGALKIKTGTKPIDGGYYIFTKDEKDAFVKNYPGANVYFRPFIGGKEFLEGTFRYIIYLADDNNDNYKKNVGILERVQKVIDYRKGKINDKSGKNKRDTNENDSLAARPKSFHLTTIPKGDFLVIPEVSSENRNYIPIALECSPTIPSNLVKILEKGSLEDFALLSSAMHMAWVRTIGGRFESRYRYSLGVIYNTFPRPSGNLKKLRKPAQKIIDIRARHGKKLTELYDPTKMPPELLKAHKNLDKAVDKLYRSAPFANDQERFVFLMNMYRDLVVH